MIPAATQLDSRLLASRYEHARFELGARLTFAPGDTDSRTASSPWQPTVKTSSFRTGVAQRRQAEAEVPLDFLGKEQWQPARPPSRALGPRLKEMGTALSAVPPYGALVQALLEQDRVSAARSLLARALNDLTDVEIRRRESELVGLIAILAPPRVRVVAETDRDRSREYRWLAAHRVSYRGEWVAVLGNHLIAAAPSLAQLREQIAVAKPDARPLIHRFD